VKFPGYVRCQSLTTQFTLHSNLTKKPYIQTVVILVQAVRVDRLPRLPVRPGTPVILYLFGNRLATLELREGLPPARSRLRAEDRTDASDPSNGMPVGLSRDITANEARLGEVLGEVGVDKRADGIPVSLAVLEEGRGELIWSTLGIDPDESAIDRVLLLVKGGIFVRDGGLSLVDDLLACWELWSVLDGPPMGSVNAYER